MIVYLITNLINGKRYVGQTIQKLKRRWDFHIYRGSGCVALKSAFEKYGKENFKIEEIYRADSLEDLCKKERDFIESLNTLAPNGYNLTTGGERPMYSEESREKMSESAKGRSSWAKGKTMEDPRVEKSITAANKRLREIYGNSSPREKIKISCMQNGKTYESIMAAAKELNLNPGGIHSVLSGRSRFTKGYSFKRMG